MAGIVMQNGEVISNTDGITVINKYENKGNTSNAADNVSYKNSTSGLEADTVKKALDELAYKITLQKDLKAVKDQLRGIIVNLGKDYWEFDSESGKYIQSAEITELTGDELLNSELVTEELAGDDEDAALIAYDSYLTDIITSKGKVTFYSTDIPTVSYSVVLKGYIGSTVDRSGGINSVADSQLDKMVTTNELQEEDNFSESISYKDADKLGGYDAADYIRKADTQNNTEFRNMIQEIIEIETDSELTDMKENIDDFDISLSKFKSNVNDMLDEFASDLNEYKSIVDSIATTPLTNEEITVEAVSKINATSVANVAAIDTLQEKLSSVTSEFNTLSAKLDNLISSQNPAVDKLPAYAINGYNELYKLIKEKFVLDNIIIFGFSTDQHLDHSVISDNNTTIINGLNVLRELSKNLPFDMIVLGGDATTTDTNIEDIQDNVINVTNLVSSGQCPIVHLVGRHDGSIDNPGITKNQLFKSHSKGATLTLVDLTSGYRDDLINNIRYIFLDTESNDSDTIQTNLTSMLSGMDSNFNAIIFSHAALDPDLINYGWELYVDCSDILSKYETKILACISGSTHKDNYIKLDGINHISTTCAGYTDLNDGYARTAGTFAGTAFDVFCLDINTKTLYAFRYGVGYHRTISLSGGVMTTLETGL